MLSPSLSQTLTLEDFLGQYRNNPRYELAEGEIIDLEPTGPQETVSGKLASKIGIAINNRQLPWFIPRTCLIRPFSDQATARVLILLFWMKLFSIMNLSGNENQ